MWEWGPPKEDVLSRYGAPSLTLDSSQGVTLVYDEPDRIRFQGRQTGFMGGVLNPEQLPVEPGGGTRLCLPLDSSRAPRTFSS